MNRHGSLYLSKAIAQLALPILHTGLVSLNAYKGLIFPQSVVFRYSNNGNNHIEGSYIHAQSYY